ncbi:MAG: MarR family winged helix-turn-helix transcriptional regulator [Anaerovoracaceae bacterium]|jgi:DNA-binding MarR family transcriptional regulator
MNEDYVILRKILKIGNGLIKNRNKSLLEHKLTSEQSVTLQYLDAHPGASASDLKEYLNISHQAARNIVERMKNKGLLYSAVSKEDARIKSVYLTEKGLEAFNIVKDEGTKLENQILSCLTDEEKETLHGLIDKISCNIS